MKKELTNPSWIYFPSIHIHIYLHPSISPWFLERCLLFVLSSLYLRARSSFLNLDSQGHLYVYFSTATKAQLFFLITHFRL